MSPTTGSWAGWTIQPLEVRTDYDGDPYTLSDAKHIEPGHEA